MNLYSLSAIEIVNKIKNSEVSAEEVALSFIERIKEFEKDIKAWAFFDEKIFLEKAKESDQWKLSGKPLGVLHGLPIAIKDIFKTDDMPTQYGTPLRENYQTRDDSSVVATIKSRWSNYYGQNGYNRTCLF